LSFTQGSKNRKNPCIRIEENSRGFELFQEILKDELLKILEGGSSFNCVSVEVKERLKIKSSSKDCWNKIDLLISLIGFDDNKVLKVQLVLPLHIFKCAGIQVKYLS
jgi:hypothetical protein